MAFGPITLPFKGDQFSFGLNYKTAPGQQVDFEFSLAAFDVDGKLDDTVYSRKPTALDGAVVRGSETLALPENFQPVSADDSIHVFPKLFVRKVEVMFLVASAPRKPGKAHDLSFSDKLEFMLDYWAEDGTPAHHAVDLKPLTGTLSSGQLTDPAAWSSSIIVAAVYLTPAGWTIQSLGDVLPYDSVGSMLPELKKCILKLRDDFSVSLEAAGKVEVKEDERVAVTRQWDDVELDQASAGRSAKAPVTKMRMDLSWTFWPAKKGEEDEEPPEDPTLEFNLVMYNKDGEEVQSISTNNREGTGAKAGRPEPEEAEEAEAEPEPEPEEEAEEGEGAEGEEGAEPPPPPPPPPAPKVDPYEFKERDVVYLDLPELQPEVVSMVLVVSHYDEEKGFVQVRSVRARLHDISAGEAEDQARCLADFGILSGYECDKSVTQVLLLKLYKEYGASAFNLFGQAGVQDVGAYVSQDPEELKAKLKTHMEAVKKASDELAKAQAAAEESGEEITKDMRPHAWRFRALGVALGGDSMAAESCEHDVKNAITYDGPMAPGVARTASEARVQFANGDTYFGAYGNDAKHGPGLYAFASGAVYAGEYAAGKREGKGVMVFPDGGTYVGAFKADKFDGHGQYRYPDGSVYTGLWAEGKKHGEGIYWDTAQGCLKGSWEKGILKGKASYDQPALRFEGEFVRGMPAGPATYTLCAHRTLAQPKFAAAHILAPEGPSLSVECAYAIPAGSGADPQIDEDGQEVEDPDKPPLPAFPKYEGLIFTVEVLPNKAPADPIFPPAVGLVEVPGGQQGVPLSGSTAAFTAGTGLVPPPPVAAVH